ncbi:hypothetical protein FB567DRAFT_498409 [Paraphoma chrysanthemicola]|uniref:Uncharacterized protein n=1 Tax=Paraphoma chrysanthemicola TaxID=798071 RepID=A0A8K0R2Z1_9PLEO|nr:hypothetical protein FB567DRAFT_498409 [Paraphoma chrysanthemicola]
MGTHDNQNLKSEADILARQSRPQRNSTWIPKTRDWRYATGVIQHDDFEDAPKARSVWDTMDYDYQTNATRVRMGTSPSRTGSGIGSDSETTNTASAVQALNSTEMMSMFESPRLELQKTVSYKPMNLRKNAWAQVTTYKRIESGNAEGEDPKYEIQGHIVRLHFTGKRKARIQEIVTRSPHLTPTPGRSDRTHSLAANPSPMPRLSSPITPATARTALTIHSPHMLDSIESLYTFPLFQRAWVDETYSFNAKHICSALRAPDAKDVEDLGANYGWYYDAPHVDAMFPPGIPLSAKEICAFYPHHVRWKGVMIRLTNNDYRGADIMGMQAHFRGTPDHHTSAAHMNNYQRDIVKTAIPGFKTATYRGKSDFNLRTDHLAPGPYLQSFRKGYSLPTFDDLLRGLQHLPTGLDARDLTQCLSWYLGICNSFTPKLSLNVLHTQSLVRALRQPLKPFGPQNLDRNALEEWRTKGCFDDMPVEYKRHKCQHTNTASGPQNKTQLFLDFDDDEVQMDLKVPIRHVLMFPFLALHGVVSEALKMGIEKAEIRQASQELDVKNDLETTWPARASSTEDTVISGEDQPAVAAEVALSRKSMVEAPKKPYRIPKRPRPDDIDTPPRSAPAGPRALAPASPYSPSPRPYHRGPMSRPWNVPAASSAYVPSQREQGSVYGRRDIPSTRPDLRRGGTYSNRPPPRVGPNQRGYDGSRDGYDAYGRRG